MLKCMNKKPASQQRNNTKMGSLQNIADAYFSLEILMRYILRNPARRVREETAAAAGPDRSPQCRRREAASINNILRLNNDI